jgi:hypothetical protein
MPLQQYLFYLMLVNPFDELYRRGVGNKIFVVIKQNGYHLLLRTNPSCIPCTEKQQREKKSFKHFQAFNFLQQIAP